MHVVLIRFDDSGFEHLTPDVSADGSFVVPFDEPGNGTSSSTAQPAGAASPSC